MCIRDSFYAVQGTLCLSFLDADSCQYAEALGLDEDLAFLAFGGANLLADVYKRQRLCILNNICSV